MVYLVDILIDTLMMQQLMNEVVPGVFYDQADEQLKQDSVPASHRQVRQQLSNAGCRAW